MRAIQPSFHPFSFLPATSPGERVKVALARMAARFKSPAESVQYAFTPVQTDGGLVQGRLVVCQRRPNGEFHYRLATAEEEHDYVSREAR